MNKGRCKTMKLAKDESGAGLMGSIVIMIVLFLIVALFAIYVSPLVGILALVGVLCLVFMPAKYKIPSLVILVILAIAWWILAMVM